MKSRKVLLSIVVIIILVAQMFSVVAVAPRATSNIRQITTLGDGKTEGTAIFSGPGNDTGLFLRIPNGAKILSATINITSDPYSPGGTNYPENVTVDLGDDGNLEWAFEGTGYGRFGHQDMISNSTNFTQSLKVPFYIGGTNRSLNIRLPKYANVTRATLQLEGSKGSGPSQLTNPSKMQSWAPNQWVNKGTSSMVDELNGQILYDTIQFDLGSIPATAFVSNATFWYGRAGTSPYETWGYSFNDQLGVHRIDENWALGVTQKLKESNPPEDTNAMVTAKVFYDWNITHIMASWVEGDYTNNGLCIHRTLAATQDKWDYSLMPYITVMYGSPGNVTMLITGGANFQLYKQTGTFDTSANVPDFSSRLNEYLATHPANITDGYGNELVDVPLSLSSTDPGRVTISNMDIAYKYSTVIDKNPTTVNLTQSLDNLVPDIIDGNSTDIKLAISSNNTGRVKVSGIDIKFLPPDHSATIDSRTPITPTVIMNENETMEFKITSSDLYKYPLTVAWFMNEKPVVSGKYNMTYYADFESAGTYNVTVIVNNSLHDTIASWVLIVKNVNRKPIIDSYEPEKDFKMDENRSATFSVKAHDPDRDIVRYAWTMDGKDVGSNNPAYTYRTDYFSASQHEITVRVLDPRNLMTSMLWSVTVRNVNAAPLITSADPAKAVTMYENQTQKFSIVDKSLDGDQQTILWQVDGKETGITGRLFEYHADFESAGKHVVKARVTDGELSTNRTWDVTVIDVNRPPVAIIDAPNDQAEFLEWDHIFLDGGSSKDPDRDQVNLTWTEGKKTLGKGKNLTVDLKHGIHEITLTAEDGRGNDSTDRVMITVRYITFEATITPDLAKPVADDRVMVTLHLTNRGDGSYDRMAVSFLVDGKKVSGENITAIEPEKEFSLVFPWNAKEGTHIMTFVVGGQNFTQTITVGKKPLLNKDNGWMWAFLLIVIIIIIVILCIAVAARRRKKAKQEQAMAAAQTMPAPQLVQPAAQPAPATPSSPYRLVPAPIQQSTSPLYNQPTIPPLPAQQSTTQLYGQPAYPPPPQPSYYPQQTSSLASVGMPMPVMPPSYGPERTLSEPAPLTSDVGAGIGSELEGTEDAVDTASANGKDVTRARNHLRLAKFFANKGDKAKVMDYCKKAKESIR